MADIFLSYARVDADRVRPFAKEFESRGYKVFWDPQIKPGELWDAVIEAELKKARCVVVIWSQRSIQSKWVRAEAYHGDENNVLVPILIDNVSNSLPLAVKLVQAADLVDVKESQLRAHPAFQKVLQRLEELLGPADQRDISIEGGRSGSQAPDLPLHTQGESHTPLDLSRSESGVVRREGGAGRRRRWRPYVMAAGLIALLSGAAILTPQLIPKEEAADLPVEQPPDAGTVVPGEAEDAGIISGPPMAEPLDAGTPVPDSARDAGIGIVSPTADPPQLKKVEKGKKATSEIPYKPKPCRESDKIDLNLEVLPWAYVTLDGKYLEETPLKKQVKVCPGKHWVRFFNPDCHYDKAEEIIVERGKRVIKKIPCDKK